MQFAIGEVMDCPKCSNNQLVTASSEEGLRIDFCPGCRGLWFDKGETAKHLILESDIQNIEAALKTACKTGLACPRCKGELEEIKYDASLDLLVDRCVSCEGIWFDFNETEKLSRWAAEKESPRVRLSRALQRLKESGYKMI